MAEVTFMIEPWSSYYPECIPLWEEHYAEFEPVHERRLEMCPDVAAYEALDRQGMLHILVARSAGRMVGYHLVVTRPHIHYAKSMCGFEDSYFLSKPFRRGRTGIRLFTEMFKHLDRIGVARSFYMTKEFNSIGVLLQRLGLQKIDTVWARWRA